MRKIIFKLVKSLCVGLIFLYSINIFLSDLDVNVPINIITIGVSTILGIPGIVSLVLLNIFII